MQLKKLKFRRQFLLTTEPILGLNSWKTLNFGDHVLYSHPDLASVYEKGEFSEVILLGYIFDPMCHDRSERDILKEIAANPRPKIIAQILYGLSGRFVLLIKTIDNLLFFNDACGLRSFYYVNYKEHLQLASQPLLLKKVSADLIVKREQYQSFFDSEYGKQKENWYPSGTSLYEGVKHLVPNHYLDSKTRLQYRYWPTNEHKTNDYDSSLQKFSTLLQNIMTVASLKYDLALGVTAGFDSRIILSASKTAQDRMLFYTLKYRDMTMSSRDIQVPRKLNESMNFDHKVMDCKIPTTTEFAKIYEQNSDMAHLDDWGFIAYGISQNLPEGKMAIKGSCSETGRCFFYKSGKHPTLSSGANLVAYNPGWKGIAFIEKRLNNWFNEVNDSKTNLGYPILDLFHWEVSTGSWQTQNQLEWDIVHDTFTPFNNRELLDVMLRIHPKYRSKPNNYKLYRDTIYKLWPELLSQPFNPENSKERIKKSIKSILVQLGFEKYNR